MSVVFEGPPWATSRSSTPLNRAVDPDQLR